MSTRTSVLALAAIAALAMSMLIPVNASAFTQGARTVAPARIVTYAPSPQWGRGYGYGRGWCYWHPYVCYRAR